MKTALNIVIGVALVWFGGAGLAFAICPTPTPMPACHCNQSQGESNCCCGSHAPVKSAPACSVNHAPLPTCACNITRGDSSNLNITVNRSANPAIVTDPAIVVSDPALAADNQTFPTLPTTRTPFTVLRI